MTALHLYPTLKFIKIALCGMFLLSIGACTTVKKDKSEVGFIGRKWHDMNARYNGYFNAKELYKENLLKVEQAHGDNYNRLIPLDIYTATDNEKLVEADMDKAIEKVVKVAALHEPSKWIDDSYVLMGKAQFLKGDYESAEETFEYFVDDFNPKDPDSRVYESPDREANQKVLRKEKEKERKIKEDERKNAKKQQAEDRKREKKEREQKKKEREKERKNSKKRKGKRNERDNDKKSLKEKGEGIVEGLKGLGKKAKDKLEELNVNEELSLPSTEVAGTSSVPVDPDEEYIRELERQNTLKKDKVKAVERNNKSGFLKHKPAYFEGMLWLAKTYVVREKYLDAGYYLRKLTEEAGVPEKVLREIPVVLSDIYLRQKDYSNAKVQLEQALTTTKDKELKARMAFILAQLYQLTDENAKAYDAFERVNDYKPSFEMALSAKLQQLKNAWAGGSGSTEKAIKELEKMAKEAKYAENLGMIYFSIAEIYLATNDENTALEYFRKSLDESTNDASRVETYYRLATLYLDKEDYLPSKSYFDSTLTVMAEADDRYPDVKKYSETLREIAKQINAITKNDSLLVLGAMVDERLDEYARKIAVKQLEDAQANEKEKGGFTATTTVLSGNSKFFAFNQAALLKGKSDFRRRWGDRPLEDDWRRSNKSSNLIDVEEEEEEEQEISEADVKKEMNKILREVPRSDEEKETMEKSVEQSMFELGTAYRTYIRNFEKSNATLGKLLNRYPNTAKRVDAYYYLYLNALDLEDKVKADEYFKRIMNEFPNSDYAKFLNDPNGDNVLVTDERKIELYYEKTYALFGQNMFETANNRLLDAKTKFGDAHHMIAKYALLGAMCVGNLQGEKEYKNALRGVILNHNNTSEQTHAREMLRFLRGDGEAFGGDIPDEALQKFVSEDNKLHYVIVILYEGTGDKVKEAKKSINDYNGRNHKDARLRSTSIYLNQPDKTHLILIRRFQDKKTSMAYFADIDKNKRAFLNPNDYSYETFAVNQKNYREVIKQKSVKTYRLFFENEYLGSFGKE